jgi:hypothetical protein
LNEAYNQISPTVKEMHMWEFGAHEDGFCILAPVVIGCKKDGHGWFAETPLRHMMGYGCPICDREDVEGLRERLHEAYEKLIA